VTDWFDEIGLAYARRYAELTEAQWLFENQRVAIERRLVACLRSAQPDLRDGKSDPPWLCFEPSDRRYWSAKKARPGWTAGASYMGFTLGSPADVPGLDGAFGFVAVAHFGMREGGSVERRIPPSLFPDLQRWRRKGGLSFSKGPAQFRDLDVSTPVCRSPVGQTPCGAC
jgi:hypothetical protein